MSILYAIHNDYPLFIHSKKSCLFIIKIYRKVDYFLKNVLINRYDINCKTTIESRIIITIGYIVTIVYYLYNQC